MTDTHTATTLLLTLAACATVLLGLAAIVEYAVGARHPRLAEAAWRGALLAALVVAPATLWNPQRETGTPDERTDEPVAVVDIANTGLPASAEPNVHVPAAGDAGLRVADSAAPHTASASARGPDPDAAMLQLHPLLIDLLPMAWLIASAGMLLLITTRCLGLARFRLFEARQPVSTELVQHAQAASAQLGLRRIPLIWRDDKLRSPVALPGNALAVPGWVEQLPPAQQRALVAHEIAHLRRHHPWLRILQHLALAPLCWHPLAWHALWRLDALAEHLCDADASRVVGSGRPVAECLAACIRNSVQQRNRPRSPRLALAMAAREGEAVRRVNRLLKGNPMSTSFWSPLQKSLLVGFGTAVCVALIAAGGVSVSSPATAGYRSVVDLEDDDGGRSFTITVRERDYRLKLKATGEVRFSEDERSIAELADGASLHMKELRDGVERELLLEGEEGSVVRRYRIDGNDVDFDADAQDWMARMILELYRRGGLDVEARTARLLQRGGVDAVLAEIRQIEADGVRARYLGELFLQSPLDDSRFAGALSLLAAIESDFELRHALQLALQGPHLERTQLPGLLALAAAIESDFERAELLVAAAPLAGRGEAAVAWAEAVAAFDSDFERRRVLEAGLAGAPDAAAVARLLLLGHEMESDFEKRSLLERAAAPIAGDPVAQAEYLALAASLDSDFEHRESLRALIDRGTVDAGTALLLLKQVKAIDSDFERGEVLSALAAAMPDDPAVISAYRAVARDMGDHERGKAERALDRFAQR